MATLPKSDPSDSGGLVNVFSTQQDSEAMVVQSLLEAAGIESLVTADVGPQDVLPMGGVVVRVAPEFEAEARRVIAESQTVPDVEMLSQAESELPPAGDQ